MASKPYFYLYVKNNYVHLFSIEIYIIHLIESYIINNLTYNSKAFLVSSPIM